MPEVDVWVAYWRKVSGTDSERKADSVWPAVLIIGATILSLAAATGAFGLTIQVVGVVLLIPLLPAAIMLLVGAPAMVFMWVCTTIANAISRFRRKDKKQS